MPAFDNKSGIHIMLLYFMLCVLVFIVIAKELKNAVGFVYELLEPNKDKTETDDPYYAMIRQKEEDLKREEFERKNYKPSRNKLYMNNLDLSWRNNKKEDLETITYNEE